MIHSDLDVRQRGLWEKRTVYQVLAPFRFSVWGLIHGEVPESFYTDFASVPRHFGMYEVFGGRCNKEAVPHDYLYRKGSVLLIDWHEFDKFIAVDVSEIALEVSQWLERLYGQALINIPKFVADLVFKQLMVEEGEDEDILNLMYNAVHLAGGSSFNIFNVADPLPMDKIDTVVPYRLKK
jgi:hypothetical protein